MSKHTHGGKMGRGLGLSPMDPTRRFNRQQYDRQRRNDRPWRAWYKLPRWHRIRMRQLAEEPSCRMCKAEGRGLVPATVVDHVERHNGDPVKFWRGPFQSLCAPCHNGPKQSEESRGFSRDIGDDGWPVDPRHPFNGGKP